jgi:hypothetical protein
MTDDDLNRRNLRLGWALFGFFWLLFGGCFGIAYLYLHFS